MAPLGSPLLTSWCMLAGSGSSCSATPCTGNSTTPGTPSQITHRVQPPPHRPWAGRRFWKTKARGKELITIARPEQELFSRFDPDICRGTHTEPGGAAHKEQVFDAFVNCKALTRKGRLLKTSRWYGWVQAALDHDATWNTRLLRLASMGLRAGAYKS